MRTEDERAQERGLESSRRVRDGEAMDEVEVDGGFEAVGSCGEAVRLDWAWIEGFKK